MLTFLWSPSGARLAAVSTRTWSSESGGRQLIAMYDARVGRRIWEATIPVRGTTTAVRLAFGSGEETLLFSPCDQDIRVHDADSGASLATLRGNGSAVESLAASPDGSRIASGAANGHVRVWDARRLELQSEHMGHEASVMAVVFSPDGRSLASGGQDGSIRIWPASDPMPLNVLRGVDGLSAAAFSPDGRVVAVVPKHGGAIELWNARTVERMHRLELADASVAMVDFSPDGRLLAAASDAAPAAGGVPIWRVDSGELVATVGDPGEAVASARFNPAGTSIVTVSLPSGVATWDVAEGKKIRSFAARVQSTFSRAGAVFGLDGTRVAGGVGQVFDARTGRPLASEVRPRPTKAIAASPDGRLMAVGVPLGDVHVEEFATGRHLVRLVGHAGPVEAVAFTAAGDRLASGGADGTARIWDVDSHECLFVLRGHEAPIRTVIFSPDGRRVVTSSADGTVRIWDPTLGTELISLPGQQENPHAVAVSPEGDVILTADESGRVSLWGLSNAAVIDARRQLPEVR